MSSVRQSKVVSIDFSLISKAHDLKKRIFLTIVLLIIFRIGSFIPLPGIDSSALQELADQNAGGILGVFNMLSGGSLARMSIFALAITPYITSSIIVQLLTIVSKSLESLKKDGESGRKRINQITRYGTVLLSMFQGFGLAAGLEAMVGSSGPVVPDPGAFFKLAAVSTLVGGTIFLMWLGEQITARGIGNGISLIIFSGIVAGLPGAIGSTFELGKTGALSEFLIIILIFLSVAVVAIIVFFERSQRRILVQYPKRQVGNKIYGGESSHIPLKLNTAGVIPPIFANSILLFPATIANFSRGGGGSDFLNSLAIYIGHGKPLYILLYIAFIVFFSFFYTSVIFNTEETADNLKKYNGFIPGRRPGKNTAEFLDYVLTRLTVIGASYLSAICILPEILIAHYSVPFYLGGASILIVVNVVIDTVTQVQTHLFSQQYEGLIKKSKLREKRA